MPCSEVGVPIGISWSAIRSPVCSLHILDVSVVLFVNGKNCTFWNKLVSDHLQLYNISDMYIGRG